MLLCSANSSTSDNKSVFRFQNTPTNYGGKLEKEEKKNLHARLFCLSPGFAQWYLSVQLCIFSGNNSKEKNAASRAKLQSSIVLHKQAICFLHFLRRICIFFLYNKLSSLCIFRLFTTFLISQCSFTIVNEFLSLLRIHSI